MIRVALIGLLLLTTAYPQIAADKDREAAIRRGLDAQDYVDAKREYETNRELLKMLKLKRQTIENKKEDLDELNTAIAKQQSVVMKRLSALIRCAKKIDDRAVYQKDGAITPFIEGVVGIASKELPNNSEVVDFPVDKVGAAALSYLEFKFGKNPAKQTPEMQVQQLKNSTAFKSKLDKLIRFPRRRVTSNPLYEPAAFEKAAKTEQDTLLMEAAMRNVIAREIGAASVQLENEFAILGALQDWHNNKPDGFVKRLDLAITQQREHIRKIAKDFDQLCEDHGVTTKTPDKKSLHIIFSKRLWEE